MSKPWACIATVGPHRLRRGTWYEVVDNSWSDTVALLVGNQRVRVDRSAVVIADGRPIKWTVVHEDPPNHHFGSLYGVCPGCLTRAGLEGDEELLDCPSCGFVFRVDWFGFGMDTGGREPAFATSSRATSG